MPNLRSRACRPLVEEALALWTEREGFRIVHYSIQSNHVHLIVEVTGGRPAVSRAMKGIKVSLARKLNKHTGNTGSVWAERYHDEVLESPRRAHRAIAYVLNNGRRHRVREAWRKNDRRVDPCSSAEVFDGWSAPIERARDGPAPVAPPKLWMLRVGWRRHGRIRPDYVPVAGR